MTDPGPNFAAVVRRSKDDVAEAVAVIAWGAVDALEDGLREEFCREIERR